MVATGGLATLFDEPDFAIARFPVTFREYCAFLDGLPEEEAARRLPRDHVRKRRRELGYGVGDVFVPQVNAPAVTTMVVTGWRTAIGRTLA